MALQKVVLRLPQDNINVLFEEAARVGTSVDVLLGQIVQSACSQIIAAKREAAREAEAAKAAAAAADDKKKDSSKEE